ncbi:MAG TPA: hypothetical protein VNT53_05115 [Pseudolysinimonas sp.]|nr:hypothetical protein [Pseudolysinimonas sp.]
MIIDFIIQSAGGFVGWVASLFPPIDIPSWIEDPLGPFATIGNIVGYSGAWVDWTILGIVITFTGGTWAVMFLIKFARAILTHFPLFGGRG